ncbi:hypothetical protein HYR99_39035 [Candidatus Poribacteria bacterium]|nr:hypothetical protein [Candidatus Poribacteria bacterium]
MKTLTYTVTIVFISTMILGCAGREKSPAYSPDKTISTSSKKPDWVGDPKDMLEKDDKLFFRGRALKVYDASLGLTQAKSDGKKQIVTSINNQIASELTSTTLGDNKSAGGVGFFSMDSIAAITGKITVNGVLPAESYYEERVDAVTEERYYDCYALIQLAKKDYNLARRQVVAGLIEKARVEKNQQAERAAMELLRKLESEK